MSKAVVLSGGGAVGIAWQTGLLAGLTERGLVLSDADFVIGTSAGSAVGAQLALGHDMLEAMARFTPPSDAPPARDSGAPSSATGAGRASDPPRGNLRGLIEQMGSATASNPDPKVARAAIGRFALDAETMDEASFKRGFEQLAGAQWPAAFRCTAVDAESGRFKVWDAAAGVDLISAVASSCAVPGMFPPITIDGRRYMDGGMRTGTNADIAKGHERVLIVTLMGGPAGAGGSVPGMRAGAERELGILRDAGAQVELVGPDDEARAVIGMDLMNPRLTYDAAHTGLRQGKALAEQLRAFWV